MVGSAHSRVDLAAGASILLPYSFGEILNDGHAHEQLSAIRLIKGLHHVAVLPIFRAVCSFCKLGRPINQRRGSACLRMDFLEPLSTKKSRGSEPERELDQTPEASSTRGQDNATCCDREPG